MTAPPPEQLARNDLVERVASSMPHSIELGDLVQDGMLGADPFAARDRLLHAYRVALDAGYRFFSFGDAMLIV